MMIMVMVILIMMITGFQWSGHEGAQTHWTNPGGDSRHCRPADDDFDCYDDDFDYYDDENLW